MPLADAYSTPDIAEDASAGGPTPAASKPIGFFDKVRLGYRGAAAGPDWGLNQMKWDEDALDEVRAGLRKRGITPIDPSTTTPGQVPALRGESPIQFHQRLWTLLFAQVDKARHDDPNFLPEFAPVVDHDSFQQLVRDRRKRALDEVGEEAPDGLGLGGFVGAIGHGFTDPTSFIPVGGEAAAAASVGRAILGTAAREAGANVAFTLATEPLVRRDARSLGIERTIGDTAFDVGAAGLTGGVIGGAAAGVPHGARMIGDTLFPNAMRRTDADAFGKSLKAHVEATDLPDSSPFKSFDVGVARAFAEATPRDKRTPDEQAAIGAIERHAEVRAGSPFLDGPHGDDEHARSLDAGMRAVNGDTQALASGTVKPIARERIAAPGDVAAARMPERELLKARIHRVEAPGANDRNPLSDALGPYQFTARTWVSLFKRRYPGDARSFEQIAGLRRDPHFNDVLINDLIAENAAALRHSGLEETSGNLYLAHFLGSDRAIKVLHAGGDTPLGQLLPNEYFHDNPWMKREWSAARLTQWAYGKMGDANVPAHLASAEHAPSADVPAADVQSGRYDVEAMFQFGGIEADRPVLKPELFGSSEAHAAAQIGFERERDLNENYAPVMSAAEAFNPYEHFDAVKGYAARRGTVTAEAIADALGISPAQAKRAVGSMAAADRNSPYMLSRGRAPKFDKLGNVTREGTEPGRIIRRPPRATKANESLLEFLTRSGGLKDEGGDLKAMGAGDWHKQGAFRRKLIDNEDGQSLDDAFQRAIDAGFFPEHQVAAETYEQLPDLKTFMEAVDEELRGHPRHALDGLASAHDAELARRYGEEADHEDAPMTREAIASEIDPDDFDFMRAQADQRGFGDLTDAEVVEAAQRLLAGQSLDEAIGDTVRAAAVRDLQDFAALAGDLSYDRSHEWEAYVGEHPEVRDYGEPDFGNDAGDGRSTVAASSAGESRAALAASADDPEAREYGDPVGVAAEAQADSFVHDLEMAVHGSAIHQLLDRTDRLALRLRWLGEQERAIGREAAMDRLREAELDDKAPWLEPDYLLKVYSDDPDAGAAILEAIAEHGELMRTNFRLDEEGGESDLASILKEIEDAQKAVATMRDCLKPKGGDE